MIGSEPKDFVVCRVVENGIECGKKFKSLHVHLKHFHDMNIQQYRREYLDAFTMSDVCRKAIATGKPKPPLTGTEGVDYVTCRVIVDGVMCDKRFRQLPMHLKHKHKMNGQQYKAEHLGAVLICSDVVTTRVAKISIALTGRTKEDYPYLAESGRKSGQVRRGRTAKDTPYLQHMADKLTGRTKETHPGVAARSEKMTGRTKETHLYIAAQSAKMTGRTKKTHQYLARMSDKLRGRTKETHEYLAIRSEKSIARWADPDFVNGLSSALRGHETKHHAHLKQQAREILEEVDWTVVEERWCVANKHNYIVDLWAIRNGCKAVIEVGACPDEKLANLRKLYGDSNVFHIPYGNEETVLKELEERCNR